MSLINSLKGLNEIDLADLDFNDISQWPEAVKITFYVVVFLMTLFFSYNFLLSSYNYTLTQQQQKEKQLKETYSAKSYQVNNLDEYKKQLVMMGETLNGLVKQLPGDTEVPGLLEDITKTGTAAGLEFNFINLQPEKAHEYYIELPINISVTGSFHSMGLFVSGVANLSRIVTLHDFKIKPPEPKMTTNSDQKQDGNILTMQIMAKTYRYVEGRKS